MDNSQEEYRIDKIEKWIESVIESGVDGINREDIEIGALMFSDEVTVRLMMYGARIALIEAFCVGVMWQKNVSEEIGIENLLHDVNMKGSENGEV